MKSSVVFYFSSLILLFLFSCKKDVPPVVSSTSVTPGGNGFLYVLNEGNFMASNGSVTRVNLNDGAVVTDFFSVQNNGVQIGDVPQSMCLHNGKFYIVINNSGKIIVVDRFSFQSISQITGLNSPRYFLPLSNNKAYVSDLYSNQVSVIDLNSNTVISSIPVPGWSEEMYELFGKVYVTVKNSNKLYVINAATDQLSDSIVLGYGAGSIRQDKFGKLWVLCSGDQTSHYAQLLKINPTNLMIDTVFIFPSLSNNPGELCFNKSKDELYFLDYGGVYKMNIYGGLPGSPFIPKGNRNFYALSVDPQEEKIYVADAIDFNQNGMIYRYTKEGVEIDFFSSGIIPGFFYFDK